ncbi:hypothetical protein BGX28_007630, partial [Mortierella sp. GBA30]
RTGTKLKRALSGRTIVETPAPAMTSVVVQDVQRSNSTKSTSDTLNEEAKNQAAEAGPSSPHSASTSSIKPINEKSTTKALAYRDQALPTFHASSADAVSKRLAALDLLTTAVLVAVPMAFWYGMRRVSWEGPSHWCISAKSKDSWTIFVCHWTYALVPGFVHLVVMLLLGYFGIVVARKFHMRHHLRGGSTDAEAAAIPYPDFNAEDEKLSVEDGNWDEGDVIYSRGRMDTKKAIQNFVEAGVGSKDKGEGLVTVFAGGPEGYVDMIEKHVQKAKWSVEFHRETWAP